jgi:hypothetical protein
VMLTNSGRVEDYDVMHNVALGATLLWAFTKEFHDVTLQLRGPSVPMLMPVLPLVFHKESADELGRRQFRGGLYRSLSADQTLPAGLQDRMVRLADRSLDSMVVAIGAGLLEYQQETACVVPARRTLPRALTQDTATPLIGTARRLGHWFGELTLEQVAGLLKIRF